MKMRNILLSLLFTALGSALFSQSTGITNGASFTPNASSVLEIKSSDKGVIFPNVSLANLTDGTTITSPATGLFVYNTNASLSGGVGYYYNSGTPAAPSWTRLVNQSGVALARNPMGEIFMNGNVTATTISATSTYYKAAGSTTFSSGEHEFSMPANNKLQYTGTKMKMFHIACTVSISSAGTNDVVQAVLYKNGVALVAGTVKQKLGGTGDNTSTAIHVMTSMSQNDYLELYIANMSAVSNLTVSNMNLFAMGFSMGMD